MPTFSKRTILVSRVRNSHDLYIGLQTNFGIKGHWQCIKSPGPNIAMRQLAVIRPDSYFPLVSWFRRSHLGCIGHGANFETKTPPEINQLLVSYDPEIRPEPDIKFERISG